MEQRLNEKLAIIQTQLKAKKSRRNTFGNYNFRSAEDILEAIKPFLIQYGVTVTIHESLIADGVIQSTATITDNLEERSASSIVGVDFNQKGMQMPQKYGSASSYAKKYALGNLFLIDDTKDSDATNKHQKETTKKPKLELNTIQFDRVVDGLKKGYSIEDVKKKYTISDEIQNKLKEIQSQKS